MSRSKNTLFDRICVMSTVLDKQNYDDEDEEEEDDEDEEGYREIEDDEKGGS